MKARAVSIIGDNLDEPVVTIDLVDKAPAAARHLALALGAGMGL